MKKKLIKRTATFVFLTMLCACAIPISDQQIQNSPVQLSHITEINSLFQENEQETGLPMIGIPVNEIDAQPGPIAAKYAIVVGISTFQAKNITPLRYAQKDAKTFYDYLLDPSGGDFKRENVFLILNEYATKSNIINIFNEIKARAEKNDLVLLFFSTHSTPPNKFGGVYIVSYDTVIKPKEFVGKSSISNEILKDFINGVKAKRLIVIMDTCYSNGTYKQIGDFLHSRDTFSSVETESYGMSRFFITEKLPEVKDIVSDDVFVMTFKPSSTVCGWGKVLFSSSADGEKSWESDTLRNSFFTYYFIEGLKLYGNVKDAFYYAMPKITDGVSKEKHAKQHPQVVSDRKEWNISLK